MKEWTYKEFSERLAGKEPVPGGGGAAALCGALGIALAAMVSNFTIGKKKYADVEENIIELRNHADVIRERLLALIEEDAAAFEPLSKAYSITKDDPNRADLLENATIAAINPPLEMMREIGKAIDVLRCTQLIGSKMLLSDAGCGAALCVGAIEAAALNVYVNTKTLIDREYAEQINREAEDLLNKYIPIANQVINEVEAELRRK